MQNSIREIIEGVPSGRIFDSHFVIGVLIKKYSDEYLTYVSGVDAVRNKTLTVHGNIGKEISKLQGSLIEKLNDLSWSANIHGNNSECACWRKI